MQEKRLQGNAQTKAPAKLNADIIKSGKRAISEEKQKQLNGMLLDAAKTGKTKRAERLLNLGADINGTDNTGLAALHFAVWNGNTEVCALLIARGANVNAKDTIDGETPLLLAAQNQAEDICNLLIDNGADVFAKNKDGWTALMRAARNGHTPTCALLLGKGASIDAKDKDGWTALMRAARNGHTPTCALLLGKGASIDAKDNYGETALIIAAWGGHTPTCAFLLEKGADLNAKAEKGDWKGMTASSIAEGNNKDKTAAFLKSMEWLADITGNSFMKPFGDCVAA
jgi:ankyrin repeat protein